jgi:hypothetical protein
MEFWLNWQRVSDFRVVPSCAKPACVQKAVSPNPLLTDNYIEF